MKSGKYGTIFEPKDVYTFIIKKDKDKFVGTMAVDIAKTNNDAAVLGLGKVKGITVDARLITEYTNVYYSQVTNYDEVVYEIKTNIEKHNVNVVIVNLSKDEMIENESKLKDLARVNGIIIICVI